MRCSFGAVGLGRVVAHVEPRLDRLLQAHRVASGAARLVPGSVSVRAALYPPQTAAPPGPGRLFGPPGRQDPLGGSIRARLHF